MNKDIDLNTSNQIFIEKTIENKFNQILDKIPIFNTPQINTDNIFYYNLNFYDIYKNTMNTVIDIINDVINLIDEKKYINDNNIFYKKLFDIFFNKKRLFYIGIILVLLSIIIYFIDGATI